MSQQTHEIMSKIDEIKEKLSNKDYIDLCNLLKKQSENELDIWNQLYLVKYFKQYVQMQNEYESDEEELYSIKGIYNEIVCKKDSVICKFRKGRFFKDEDDIKSFIRTANNWHDDFFYDISFVEVDNTGMKYISKHPIFEKDIIIPGTLNNKVDLSKLGKNPNQISFRKTIIYSIEKVN